MLTISKVRSPEYLFNGDHYTERSAMAQTVGADGKPNYYAPRAADDVLMTPAILIGKLNESMGFKRGALCTEAAYSALSHCIDPRDGKTPLRAGAASLGDQLKLQAKLDENERKEFNSKQLLGARRRSLFNSGVAYAELIKDAKVAQLTTDLATLKAEREKLKKDPAYSAQPDDYTFSAPKAVSVYWSSLKCEGAAGNAQAAAKAVAIEKAVLESAADTMDLLEQQLILFRERIGNKERVHENVKGLSVALIQHFESRATEQMVDDPSSPNGRKLISRLPDPQMHVHSVLMQMGLTFEDDVRSIWTGLVSDNIEMLGASFRAALAHRLRGMGMDLTADTQEKIASFGLLGISEATVANYSARGEQVKGNQARGLTGNQAKLEGRLAKDDYTGAELVAGWAERHAAYGVSFKAIEAATFSSVAMARAEATMKAGEQAGAFEFARGSQEWLAELTKAADREVAKLKVEEPTAEAALKKLMQMGPSFSHDDLARVAAEASQFCGQLAVGDTPRKWAERFRADIVNHRDVVITGEADDHGRVIYTTASVHERERKLYNEMIPELQARRDDQLTLQQIDAAIAQIEAEKTKERGAAFKYSESQIKAAREVAMGRSIHLFLAPAGCGKTTTALPIVRAIETATGGKTYALAPSLKAAKGVSSELGMEEGMSPQRFIGLVEDGTIKLNKNDLVVLDEGSMADGDSCYGLAEAIRSAKGGPCRWMIMGDTEQLPAVGRGNFLRSLVMSNSFQASGVAGEANVTMITATLADWTRIQRQRADLGKIATTFFALGHTARALQIYERMGGLRLAATEEEAKRGLAYEAYLPMASVADERKASLATHRPIYDAFRDRGERALAALAREGGAIDQDVFAARFAEPDQGQARAWLDSREALELSAAKLRNAYSSILMIATKNKDVHELNEHAREILQDLGALGGIDGSARGVIKKRYGEMEVCEGDRLMFAQKLDGRLARFSKKGGMATKSMVGTVTKLSRDADGDLIVEMVLDGGAGESVSINTAHFPHLTHAFALTAHASQGATCENVYKYLSDFAGMQTEYVGSSRHRDALVMWTVADQYEAYKKRAVVAIEKTESRDMRFAEIYFSLDKKELDELEAAYEKQSSGAKVAVKSMQEARKRSIAQGTLIEHGLGHPNGKPDKPGAKPMYFAKLEVAGRKVTMWGDGIRKALESSGVTEGGHVGLECVAAAGANGSQPATWRAYTADTLDAAGLLMDERGLMRRAKELLIARQGRAKKGTTVHEDTIESPLVIDTDAEALAKATVAKEQEIAAKRARERGILSEYNRRVALPSDLPSRLERAEAVIPYAKPNLAEQARKALRHGIEVYDLTRPMTKGERTWLSHDGELAYCLTTWDTVEAWPAATIRKAALNEAQAAGSVEELERRRADALSLATEYACKPVAEAFAGMGHKLDISIYEHAELGMCLGIAARDGEAIFKDAELNRFFFGDKKPGEETFERDCIKGTKNQKGFKPTGDDGEGAWMFPLACVDRGMPSPSQPAIDELAALGKRLGLRQPADAQWQGEREEAWTSISTRLSGAWGLAWSAATRQEGIETISPKAALRFYMEKEDDIARWNAKVVAGDETQNWQMCPVVKVDDKALPEKQRLLSSLILHANDKDIFVRGAGERIIAVERSALGLSGDATDALVGKLAKIRFEHGQIPTLEAPLADPKVMGKAIMAAAEVAKGDKPDESKMGAPMRWAWTRAQEVAGDTPSPQDAGFALAWAASESTQLRAMAASRSAGMSEKAQTATLLELASMKAMGSTASSFELRNVRIVESGESGILLAVGKSEFLADRKALAEAVGNVAPREIGKLRFDRDDTGRMLINARETRLAATRGAGASAAR
jgi:ATP-dependent exoDNAse (exonuclease V) alpha subunit